MVQDDKPVSEGRGIAPPPWRKLGRVLQASGEPLSRTHAMLPTPFVMRDRIRVFYASCDSDLRGRVFFADFAPAPPFRLLGVSAEPVLDVGGPGAFDRDGVNPSQIIETEGGLALLYIGWRRGPPETPYTLFGGVADSVDGGRSFTRRAAPLLPPRPGEQLFRTAPFIDKTATGYRLLYIGGDSFLPGDGLAGDGKRRLPLYSLMEMTSDTLWDWSGPARSLMGPDVEAGEVGFGRPVVVRRGGVARLLISVRTRNGYQLVETQSDIVPNMRPTMTPVALHPLEPWEQQMTCFGATCHVGGHELLFYNGDGFGLTGMGLAWRPETSWRPEPSS